MSSVLLSVIVVGAIAMGAALIVGVLVSQKRRRKRTRMSPFNASTTPPAPTLDHIRALEPWMSSNNSRSESASSHSGVARSSAPSQNPSIVHSVTSLTIDKSTGKVMLMKDAPMLSEYNDEMNDIDIIDVDVI